MCDYFLGNIWQQVLPWQHFLMFLALYCLLEGSWNSKPLHGLELVSFLMITGNKCAMATFFSVSWTYKYFMGSLLWIPRKTNQLQL